MKKSEINLRLIKYLCSVDESAGKLPDSILKLKKYLSKEHVQMLVKEFQTNPSGDLVEFLRNQAPVFKAHHAEGYIRKLAEGGKHGNYRGEVVDNFSAFMISRAMDKLSTEQKVRLLNRPLSEITAIAYKLATRIEY